MKKKSSTETAMSFLCKRNTLDIPHNHYAYLLMDFESKQGGEAIEGLAGFFLWAVRNLREKQNEAIISTFTHDLQGRNEEGFVPRSGGFAEMWRNELANL